MPFISLRKKENHFYLATLLSFDYLQHGLGEGSRRIVVTSGIIGSLTDNGGLDLLVVNMEGETLAPTDDSDGRWTGVGHFHTQSLGKSRSWIGYECDHGSFNSLVLAPCLHDGRIVYTVNDDLLDSGGLESFLILKVSRNLLCGSGRGECAWKTDDDNVLPGAVIGDVDTLWVRESLHNLN